MFVLCLSASEARKFIEVASDVIGLYKAALITLEYITLSEADMDDNIFTGKKLRFTCYLYVFGFEILA